MIRNKGDELLVNVHDLQHNFTDVKAGTSNSFDIHCEEIFGSLRPNGAKKTITKCWLIGQIEPSGGLASVASCDGIKDRDRLKRMIGIVF